MHPLSIVTGILLGSALSATLACAQNYPWCAQFADGAGTNCGFLTLEQCMATSAGSGGSCQKNDMYKPSAAAAAAPAHSHRSKKNSD